MSTGESALDDTLLGAPAEYITPATRPSLEEARAWCAHLTQTHYENFHVATFFLPKALKPHFESVYAFCRTSDDLGDEVGDTATAKRLLAQWRAMLHECFAQPERSRHPVFVALRPTIDQCALPMQPFDDLISAFEQDQVYTRHASLATLEEYSRYSANPVGRLVLLVSGYHDESLFGLSDEICTGLQLANFYQDVVTDWVDRDRRYLPADQMARFGVTDAQIAERRFDANFRAMMEFLVADARARLLRGSAIVQGVDRELAATLQLFVNGGLAILDAIAAQDYDTLKSRPVVTRAKKLQLLAGALAGKVKSTVLPARETRSPEVVAAYEACRAIAKREAKNFYYAFLALPKLKSDAMCAVYAFMRKADDLADDESMTIRARRDAMAAWTAAWHRSRTAGSDDPVFIALNDTQQRFGISSDLLEKLVAGTTMDLDDVPLGADVKLLREGDALKPYQVYTTQKALEDYCYLVASVVGLVCIRIFGYTDHAAEALAIDTGKAFQLTNILRDIKEDAERGRIYLPLSLMEECAVAPERLVALTRGASPQPNELAMLAKLTERAELLYASGDKLIPLLDKDAQPAMRVLKEIYYRLLQKIAAHPGITLHERVSVPTAEKLAVLGRGMASTLAARIRQ